MFKISERFWVAVKTSRMKGYEIANHAGLHPATLSKLLWEVKTVRPDDYRVIAVAKVLGLSPEECFEEVNLVRRTNGKKIDTDESDSG